jgi:hypothetical protein
VVKATLIVAALIWGLWYFGQTEWAQGTTSGGGSNSYSTSPVYNDSPGAGGCGSRGGPGYRLANGKCASWSEYYNIRYGGGLFPFLGSGGDEDYREYEDDIDYDRPVCYTARYCE